jgi:ABC-2 type transport system ATP-binding protein
VAEPVVDVAGLARAFAGRPAISGLSMRLERGGMIGLVGANGGGKTTSLRMLAGLLRPDAGSGTVLGSDILSGRIDHGRIGYMVQGITVAPELTVLQTLRFHAGIYHLSRRETRIAECIERYSLDAVLSQRIATLSGGWARRVQFAATLLHEPDLLLLDEPTAGIDAKNRHLIWEWLHRLAEGGSAIVVSTHDLAEAERCPQVILYDSGQAEGPLDPASLIARTRAKNLEQAVLARAAS